MNLKTPVVSIPFAMVMLGLDRDAVLNLVEDGRLPIAFDISRGGARREIRILSMSLTDYMEKTRNTPTELPAILNAILPAHIPPPLVKVARMLCASPELIRGHVADRTLALLPGDKSHRGRGGSPRIQRPSLVQFLTARVV